MRQSSLLHPCRNRRQALAKPMLLGMVMGLLLLLVAGLFYWRRPRFETQAVRRGEIVEAVYGLGTVKTDAQYEVKLGVASSLDKLYVKEGEKVAAGAPLVRFEGSLIFKTPIAGTVTLVAAHLAELVPPQSVVVRVENLQDRYIEVAMEQAGALRLQSGQKAVVLFESLRGEKYEGSVQAIFSRDQEFLAHIKIGELHDNILPGMTADVAIEIAHHSDALLVPLSALQGGRVIVAGAHGKKKVAVKIGAIDSSWAEVIEGDLQAGDLVIVRQSNTME